MSDSHTRLREEYLKKYYDSDFDSGAMEMPDPDLMADFWLSHFSTELESIRKEIAGLRKEMKTYDSNLITVGEYEEFERFNKTVGIYNQAIDDSSLLLSNRIQK